MSDALATDRAAAGATPSEPPHSEPDYAHVMTRNIVRTSMAVLEQRWSRAESKRLFSSLSLRQMFRALCVLKSQQQVPISMLRRLWGFEDDSDALQVMKALNDLQLVEVTAPHNYGELASVLSAHDDILDVIMLEAQEHGELQSHFKRLVDNYLPTVTDSAQNDAHKNYVSEGETTDGSRSGIRKYLDTLWCWKIQQPRGEAVESDVRSNSSYSQREWWTVEDEDKYVHNNTCRLLNESGNQEELLWLVHKPQWIIKRLRENGAFAVERDIAIAMRVLEQSQMEQKDEMKSSLEAIAEASSMGDQAVRENPRHAWLQLYTTLLPHAHKSETLRRFVDEVASDAESNGASWAEAAQDDVAAATTQLEGIEVDGSG